ncbi:hypothetical protein JCM3774_003492 [Rhodotorula dairenensis]
MLTVQPERTAGAESAADRKLFDSLAGSFARAKRAVVLVGAGISTNAGIPDFRSAGSGLYARSNAARTAPPSSASRTKRLRGADMFNAAVYASPDTASEHLRFLADLKTSLDSIVDRCGTEQHPATDTHDFMRLLKKRNKLLRVYTQNIDGLEGIETGLNRVPLGGTTPAHADPDQAGPSKAVKGKGKARAGTRLEGDYVQLHGTLWSVRCTSCTFVRRWNEDDHEAFADGSVGSCPACEQRASIRSARGQRSLSSLDKAFLRPAITLYDEPSPGAAAVEIGDLALSDSDPKRGADLMLVMGTSLRIPGFKALVKEFAKTVRARGGCCILVNRDEISSKSEWNSVFDYEVVMDSDAFVRRILDGWKRVRPRDWSGLQKTLGEMFAKQKKAAGGTDCKKPSLKKRAPLAELSTNSIAARSSENLQLATPPPSNRKRPRTSSFVLSDEGDRGEGEVYATVGRSLRNCLATTPPKLGTSSKRLGPRDQSGNSLTPEQAPARAVRPPSPVSPSHTVRRSNRSHGFVLEIPALRSSLPRPEPLSVLGQVPKPVVRAALATADPAGWHPFELPMEAVNM